jgi:hypothetical protein
VSILATTSSPRSDGASPVAVRPRGFEPTHREGSSEAAAAVSDEPHRLPGRATALRLARLGSTTSTDLVVLVHRPRGVAHVYVGPLTPSGGFVPRCRRTVCGTRTRRLTVDGPVPVDTASARRMCRRCTTCLHLGKNSQVVQLPTRREDWQAEFAGVTAWHLAVVAFMAETVTEVERLEWLALLVVGFPACRDNQITAPTGKVLPPLDVHVARARVRVGAQHVDPTGRRLDVLIAEGMQQARAEKQDLWRNREERIRQLGFINATG